MNYELIRDYRQRQPQLEQALKKLIQSGRFVYIGNDQKERLAAKIHFLAILKRDLRLAFGFDDYQSEFVLNEAMKRVLYHTNEDILVFRDTRTAQKLVKTSFLLGHHYFRFNLSQF